MEWFHKFLIFAVSPPAGMLAFLFDSQQENKEGFSYFDSEKYSKDMNKLFFPVMISFVILAVILLIAINISNGVI